MTGILEVFEFEVDKLKMEGWNVEILRVSLFSLFNKFDLIA